MIVERNHRRMGM